jgi:hypothetical protein
MAHQAGTLTAHASANSRKKHSHEPRHPRFHCPGHRSQRRPRRTVRRPEPRPGREQGLRHRPNTPRMDRPPRRTTRS